MPPLPPLPRPPLLGVAVATGSATDGSPPTNEPPWGRPNAAAGTVTKAVEAAQKELKQWKKVSRMYAKMSRCGSGADVCSL